MIPRRQLPLQVSWFLRIRGPSTDDSGIAQYRSDTNAAQPTSVTNGTLLSGIYITQTLSTAINNGDFEVGYNGLDVTQYPTYTNNWLYLGSLGGTGTWTSAEHQSGTNAMRHTLSSGTLQSGGGRYTLVSQYIPVDNTNNWPVRVTFSGRFKGDMSHGSGGVAFLKAECLDSDSNILLAVSDEYDTDHNGAPLTGVNAANWTNVTITITNGPAATDIIMAECGINALSSGLAMTGYWDNLSWTVTVEQLDIATGVTYTNAPEGSNTIWLFSVDDDDDRLNDRLMSPVTSYIIYLDTTTPAEIAGLTSSPGYDDATEVDLTWTALSQTGAVGTVPLSPFWSYQVFWTDEDRDPTTNDTSVVYEDGYFSLNTNTTSAITLSNFVPDTAYRFAIAGRDHAGNLGPLSRPTTNLFQGFYMTQGVVQANGTVPEFYWTAATNALGDVDREYDLMYCDALNFTEALTNEWKLLSSGYTNVLSDLGSGITPPNQLVNTMRFYRAAMHDRWLSDRDPRVASAEIYGVKTFRLYRGQNWVALPFTPDCNTVVRVFGNNQIQGGPDFASSDIIDWYQAYQGESVKTEVWLDNSGTSNNWRYSKPVGKVNQIANDLLVPVNEGVVITVRTNHSEPQVITFVGRVPTQTVTKIISGNSRYNLVGFNSPRWTHPSQMNLLESGFKGGKYPQWSDRIWVFNRSSQDAKADIWYDSDNARWRLNQTPNFPNVPNNYFGPDDAMIILTSATNTYWTWTNTILYSSPTRTMTP